MCKSINKRFRGLYWRQLFVTSGMVLLTLMLLGASFFSLSYNYVLGQRSEELRAKAKVVAQLSSTYLENSMTVQGGGGCGQKKQQIDALSRPLVHAQKQCHNEQQQRPAAHSPR